ncbi:MAG TPA: PilN domain-containing protein [Patescibacteria group bacterium]|nr:PilN domain-containing protein [Patescibacteria group bacterium]
MPAGNISVNLLGDSDMEHTPVGRIVSWAITYGRYIMIGTEIVVLLAFISRFSLDRRLTDLNDEISQKQDIIQANLDFEQDVRSLQDKLAKIKTLTAVPINTVDAVAQFQSLVPAGVYLQSLDLSKNQITIQADAGSTPAFSQFIANLQAAKNLTALDIGDIKRDSLTGIQFTFTTQVVPTTTK